jgi:hypothetical protein
MTAMSDRASQLHQIADQQVSELVELISTCDTSALALPCPGRGKLGDGTVAACAAHSAENYLRIAAFVSGAEQSSGAGHRGMPRHRRGLRLLRRLRGSHGSGHQPGAHGAIPGADQVDRDDLLRRLSAGRDALTAIAGLRDDQLDAIPPAGEMKFCDGKRSRQEIVASLLRHQRHQVDAVRNALGTAPAPAS